MRFEVYLQFDSLQRDALMELRGADLTKVRVEALEALERNNISTTLVVTLKKGVNDAEIADIVRFALDWRCVRGVTFQPIQDAGRNEGFDPKDHRIVLTEVRRRIAEAGVFALEDLIPLPCNPDQICIGYGENSGDRSRPCRANLRGRGPTRSRSKLSGAQPWSSTARLHRPGRHLRQAGGSAACRSRWCRRGRYANTFRVVVPVPRPVNSTWHGEAPCVHFVQPDGDHPFDTATLNAPRRRRRLRKARPMSEPGRGRRILARAMIALAALHTLLLDAGAGASR